MKSALRCVGKHSSLFCGLSAVLVVAPPALRAALQFIPLLWPWLSARKTRQTAAWIQLGSWISFCLQTPMVVAMPGNILSWVGFLWDLQIHRVLLLSCMQHVERNGWEKQIQLQPAPEGCPQLQYSLSSNLSEESLERIWIVGWGFRGQEPVMEPVVMAGVCNTCLSLF